MLADQLDRAILLPASRSERAWSAISGGTPAPGTTTCAPVRGAAIRSTITLALARPRPGVPSRSIRMAATFWFCNARVRTFATSSGSSSSWVGSTPDLARRVPSITSSRTTTMPTKIQDQVLIGPSLGEGRRRPAH